MKQGKKISAGDRQLEHIDSDVTCSTSTLIENEYFLEQFPDRLGRTLGSFKILGIRWTIGPTPGCYYTPVCSIILTLTFLILSRTVTNSFPNDSTFLNTILGIATFLLVGNLLLVAFLDPGRKDIPLTENEYILHNGKFKCPKCLTFKTSTYSHCDYCDLCTEDLDHHCGLLGTCIGRRNRLLFHSLLPVGMGYGLLVLFICYWIVSTAVKNAF